MSRSSSANLEKCYRAGRNFRKVDSLRDWIHRLTAMRWRLWLAGGLGLGLMACQSPQQQLADTSAQQERECGETGGRHTVAKRLSQTCLYRDTERAIVSSQLHRFTPNYRLWSDGADKLRWVYLPPNSRIDVADPDQWVFPVGTQFFKQFSKPVRRADGTQQMLKIETRHLQKLDSGVGVNAWSMVTYAWNREQTDAFLVTEGVQDALATGHNIPSQEDCETCHKGNRDIILGFDAIQLSDAQAHMEFGSGAKRAPGEWSLQTLLSSSKLSQRIQQPSLPGSELEQKTLGYLHANCGNCHNPLGHAAEREAKHLVLKHSLAHTRVEDTDVYRTAVNQPTKNFTIVPFIAMGAREEEMALYRSAMFIRINSIDEHYRMPMIDREVVDDQGLALIRQWLLSLPTPESYDFGFDRSALQSVAQAQERQADHPLDATPPQWRKQPGLQVVVRTAQGRTPPVMAVYWPEDKSLQAKPVMDHEKGYFTEKLIVGNPGSRISLRNSDDVGHTIYVRDQKENVHWQLNYMAPGSKFERALDWGPDVFVELRCRLHLYMSAWVGSIESQYHKIMKLDPAAQTHTLSMQNFPPHFTKLKIWLPKHDKIQTEIQVDQEVRLKLTKNGEGVGWVFLNRQ